MWNYDWAIPEEPEAEHFSSSQVEITRKKMAKKCFIK